MELLALEPYWRECITGGGDLSVYRLVSLAVHSRPAACV